MAALFSLCRRAVPRVAGVFLPLAFVAALVAAPVFSPRSTPRSVAWAAGEGVIPTLKAFKVVVREGREELVGADKIRPGEVIEYQVQYRNAGKTDVRDLQATLPLPASLHFVGGSARPSLVRASVDGKRFALLPLRRAISQADGSRKIVAVPLSQYRVLRWNIGTLKAGQSITVAARAKLPG